MTGRRPSIWSSVVPPGSSSLVGGLLGLAGLQAGVQAQQTYGEGEAIWFLLTRGWEAFISAIAALPDPPLIVWVLHTLWAALLLAGSGGWIRTMVDEAREHPPTGESWLEGMRRTPVAIVTWLVGLAVTGHLLVGAALVPLTLYRARMEGRFPVDDWASNGLWVAGVVIGMTIAWWAAVSLAIATLAAIHRVYGPPGSPVLDHAWRLFRQGRGSSLLRQIVGAWCFWCVLRAGITSCLPLLAATAWPFMSNGSDLITLPWAIVGALACVGINLADTLMVLWTLREACQLYARTPLVA